MAHSSSCSQMETKLDWRSIYSRLVRRGTSCISSSRGRVRARWAREPSYGDQRGILSWNATAHGDTGRQNSPKDVSSFRMEAKEPADLFVKVVRHYQEKQKQPCFFKFSKCTPGEKMSWRYSAFTSPWERSRGWITSVFLVKNTVQREQVRQRTDNWTQTCGRLGPTEEIAAFMRRPAHMHLIGQNTSRVWDLHVWQSYIRLNSFKIKHVQGSNKFMCYNQ